MADLPTRSDVLAAAARLRGHVVRTPTLRSAALDDWAGVELWLKCENLQHIGAFKARGAFNSVMQLTEDQRRHGVITYSSGNHAQAVALAARTFGLSAEIFMPTDAPPVKREVVERLGATVHLVGTTSLERHQAALARQRETGATIIEPFDHPHTIAGQGTATVELLEDVAAAGAELDALIVPVGGGGLLAGACLAAETVPAMAIACVEPLGCDSMGQSLACGQVTSVDPGPTLADGLKPTRVGEMTLALAQRRVASCHTVEDRELAESVRALALLAKLVVEPSGAAGVALAARTSLPGNPRRIGVLLSGGNIAPHTLMALIGERASTLDG